jgi:hypothetical protein
MAETRKALREIEGHVESGGVSTGRNVAAALRRKLFVDGRSNAGPSSLLPGGLRRALIESF